MGLNKYLLILLAILFIGFCISLALLIRESSQCSQNPFVFGAKRSADSGLEMMCKCDFDNPYYASFRFNHEGIYPVSMDSGIINPINMQNLSGLQDIFKQNK